MSRGITGSWARLLSGVGLAVSLGACAGTPDAPGSGEAPDATGEAPGATAAAPRGVGTMSDLMVHLIYPTSDAVFYITTRTPETDSEWEALEASTLTLAEAANLLMMPSRRYDDDQWMLDAQLMLDAGEAAFRAAQERDVAALEALNDPLYQSCVTCHQHYRPGYGR